MRHRLAALLPAGLALVLGACAKAVLVPARFPEPLIEPLPVTAGVYYPPTLADYTYSETLPGETTWTLNLGPANVALFDSVFRRLFRATVRLASVPGPDMSSAPGGGGPDVLLEPNVQAFEFGVPSHSSTQQYEVWIRYNLNVYRPDGTLIKTFPVSGYGQSDSRTLQGEKSMEDATVLAMRDAAAALALEFGADQKLRAILLGEPAPSVPPPTQPEEISDVPR